MRHSNPQPGPRSNRNRRWAAAKIVLFDLAGPLVAYWLLRSAGQSAVSALVLSGILPAFGVAMDYARQRRLDVIGVLVLAGIAVGTILGLVSGDPRLVLVEGSIPTAVFGLACLGSLWFARPLIFRFAHEFIGPDTDRGRDFAALWQYPGFRHSFRLFTVVWGAAYLAEAAARVIIAETASTGTALTVSKVMPYAVGVVLVGWMIAYGRRARRKGEQLPAAAQRSGERPDGELVNSPAAADTPATDDAGRDQGSPDGYTPAASSPAGPVRDKPAAPAAGEPGGCMPGGPGAASRAPAGGWLMARVPAR
jgi:hypothetical protein